MPVYGGISTALLRLDNPCKLLILKDLEARLAQQLGTPAQTLNLIDLQRRHKWDGLIVATPFAIQNKLARWPGIRPQDGTASKVKFQPKLDLSLCRASRGRKEFCRRTVQIRWTELRVVRQVEELSAKIDTRV
jgi:hypothetical protein